MSLLTDLASSTSVLLFGPPAPVSKDPLPPPTERSPIKASLSPPTSPSSRRAALLRPNLGLAEQKSHASMDSKDRAKVEELPLPPPPAEEVGMSAASLGASALSLLGSAVMGIGSVAASALSSATSDADAPSTKADNSAGKRQSTSPATETPKEGTMLGAISNAVLGRAASIRDAAIDSVTDTATALATSAAHAITDTASGIATSTLNLATGRSSSQDTSLPNRSASVEQMGGAETNQVRRASTLPIQYTATGEPFSSDPSISAMQRIPDHPCGHIHTHRTPLIHCCSAPELPTTMEEPECTCKCSEIDENTTTKDERAPGGKLECTCQCHSKTVYAKRQSGHFHRVEQLVKGTKRVVRDIKNVL